MKAQGRYQTLIGCVFSYALVLFVSGCGGGGGGSDTPPGGNPPPGGLSLSCGSVVSSEVVHADAGDIVGVRVNETAILDGGCSSTTLTDPLSYTWSFTSKPDASNAQLQNPTSINPSFIPDVAGNYRVQLVVTAGGISSRRAIGSIEASVAGHYTGIRVHTRYTSQCADCHDGRFAQGDGPVDPVLPKVGTHPATSNMCQACHTTFGFNIIGFVDHLEVTGNCSSCHNGVLAIGKSEFHVITTAECDDCHNTTSFLNLDADGKYDHSGITNGCALCHNGKTAIGTNHITDTPAKSNNDCSFCHTIDSFKNAYPDHSNITDNCASCHNGTDATGPKVGHPVMSVDCSVCHSTTSFSLGGVFNHRVDPAEQPCAGCHNDNNTINARGKASKLNHVATTADCGVCHGVGGGNFANGIFEHTGIVDNCSNCHEPSPIGDGSGLGKSINHMPTTADCSVCHTPGTFATGVFDHDPAVVDPVNCDSCHDGNFSVGKIANHVPTSEDCRVCHLTTDTFVGAVFDHTGIDTSNCALCHDGNIAPGKSAHHMVTSRDCSDCHGITNFTDFTGGTFDHAGVSNNCASCHDGVIALGKKVNHIPAQTECSQCHNDTSVGGFASSVFLSNVHPNLATGCEGCHTSPFFSATSAVVKATSHLPTSQDCHFCHNNVAFNPSIFDHTGISDNCASCHDGSANNVAVNALGKTSVASGHPDTTEDCGVCHGLAGGSFANATFDHTGRVDNCNECHADGASGASTKKNVGHVPTTQDCSVCHVPGTFATAVFSHDGIVDNCASCHDGSVATATVKSGTHLPTTEDCSVCHNTTAFAGARFDHQGIIDNCASCHDGVTAIGKDGGHVPTNDDCSVCHLTTGFVPGTFDHVGIVDNCVSCHDGGFAQGKKTGHVLTSEDCGVCHTTRGFIPATFDHSTVSASTRCDSCHIEGSASATGKDDKTNPPHIATSLDCRSCHTTATFVGGTWTHDSTSVGICDTCHNDTGGGASGKSSGHFTTDFQCDVCHSTNGWAPTIFVHSSQGDYPGDHRRDPGCTGCHGNSVTTPFVYPAAQYAPYCAACHKNDFRSTSRHNGGSSGTVEQNKDCSGGGSGCHRVSSSSFG